MNNELYEWRTRIGFTESEETLKIYYSAEAWVKTTKLIAAHDMEIGWNMVIKPYKDGYKVYDILVYPQVVSPAYISVDRGKYGLWKANLTDEEDANLFGHGHSHVEMAPFSSMTDEQQQHDEIISKSKGFFFFQIWNKFKRCNSFFYDIDNKIYYANEKIEIILDYDMDEFIANSFRMIGKESYGSE